VIDDQTIKEGYFAEEKASAAIAEPNVRLRKI